MAIVTNSIGKPPGVADAELRPLRETVERHVARCDFVPARRDPDLALAPVGVGHPDRAQHRAGAGLLHAVGHVPAARLHVVRLWAHVFQRIGGPTLTDVALVLVATGDGVVPILDGVPRRRSSSVGGGSTDWLDGATSGGRSPTGTRWCTATATAPGPSSPPPSSGSRACFLHPVARGAEPATDASCVSSTVGSRRATRSTRSRAATRGTPSGAGSRTCDRSRRPPTIAHCSPTSTSVGSRVPGTVARAGSPPSIRTPTCTRCVPTRAIPGSCSPRPRSVSRSAATAAPRWDVTTDGLHATYLRAVAYTQDAALVSACDGPFGKLGALYRWDTLGRRRPRPRRRRAAGVARRERRHGHARRATARLRRSPTPMRSTPRTTAAAPGRSSRATSARSTPSASSRPDPRRIRIPAHRIPRLERQSARSAVQRSNAPEEEGERGAGVSRGGRRAGGSGAAGSPDRASPSSPHP